MKTEKKITLKMQVRTILTHQPSTRDNNEQLFVALLEKYYGDPKELLYKLFLKQEGHAAPKFESVTRASRALQASIPSLRGKLWKAKQKHSVEVAKDLDLVIAPKKFTLGTQLKLF